MGGFGEEWALIEWIYCEFSQQIWQCAAKYVGEFAAEDITHEVMITLMERLEAVEGRSMAEIRAYVMKLAKHKSIDYLRGTVNQTGLMEVIWQGEDYGLKTTLGNPEEWIEGEELVRLLKHIVRKLTPENRIALEYYFKRHMSHKEIAEELHLSRKTVDQRICCGRKEIRRALQGVGYRV